MNEDRITEFRSEWQACKDGSIEVQNAALDHIAKGLLDALATGVAVVWREGLEPEQVRTKVRSWLNEGNDLAEAFEGFYIEPGAPLWANGRWNQDWPERTWLVKDWLPAGQVVLVTGQGGAGKSRLSLQLAASMAAGRSLWLGPGGPTLEDDTPTPAVIVTYEDDAQELGRRLQAMVWEDQGGRPCSAAQLVEDRLLALGQVGPLWEPDPKGSRHIATVGVLSAAGRWVRAYAERQQARLLVIDPLAAAFGQDENSRALVRAFMSAWSSWAQTTGVTVLFVAHPPKGQQAKGQQAPDYSGSTDWLASCRAMWTLGLEQVGNKDTDGSGTVLRCVKSSYAALPHEHWLRGYPAWSVTDSTASAEAVRQIRKANPHG